MNQLAKRAVCLLLAAVTVFTLFFAGGLPARTEATALKKGSSGSAVKNLQNNLIGLGYLDGSADGRFGSRTKAAVERFQADFGLAVDGSAGDDTQTAIRNAVVRLQIELNNAGYNPGGADGHYGSKTKNALKVYQRDKGLRVTGAADSATWKKLNAGTSGMKVTSTLRRGSGGSQVKYLQMALIGLGYLSGSADGSYGPNTVEAVKKYQSAYGLSSDGSAGPDTLVSIKNTVVALQSDLNRAGYPSGTINGVYGNGTTSAVKKYQRAKGIAVTGVAGPQTMKKLYGRAPSGSAGIEDTVKVPIDPLYQSGDRSKVYYYNGGRKSTTVAKSGCGGVALAMALNALLDTDEYTGQNVMQWYADNGFYYGSGTHQEGIWEYPKELGLRSTYCDARSTLVSHLKKGRLAVALIKDKTGDALFTYSGSRGHYILISGYRLNDGVEQVYINNPLSYKPSKWFDLTDLMENVLNDWNGYENSFVVIYD